MVHNYQNKKYNYKIGSQAAPDKPNKIIIYVMPSDNGVILLFIVQLFLKYSTMYLVNQNDVMAHEWWI